MVLCVIMFFINIFFSFLSSFLFCIFKHFLLTDTYFYDNVVTIFESMDSKISICVKAIKIPGPYRLRNTRLSVVLTTEHAEPHAATDG